MGEPGELVPGAGEDTHQGKHPPSVALITSPNPSLVPPHVWGACMTTGSIWLCQPTQKLGALLGLKPTSATPARLTFIDMAPSAPRTSGAFSRTFSKISETPNPSYLAPNDHCPRHKHLCRIPPDAWRRHQCGVTFCFSYNPGEQGCLSTPRAACPLRAHGGLRLYMVMICRQFISCRLYSWILFTCTSNMEEGLIFTLYSFSRYEANFTLFSWVRTGTISAPSLSPCLHPPCPHPSPASLWQPRG